MTDLSTDKKEWRRKLRGLRPAPGVLAEESRALCRVLRDWPRWREAGCLAAFWPLPGEADLRPLLLEALAEGRTLALPVTARDFTLTFRRITAPEDLVPDAWGIPAPGEACPALDPEEADLLLVPLVGIDRAGHRLGHGGGCYDRLFSAHPALPERAAGVALTYQLAERLPAGPLDCRLPLAATPAGILPLF